MGVAIGAHIDWSNTPKPKIEPDTYCTLPDFSALDLTPLDHHTVIRNQYDNCVFETMSVLQMSNHFNAMTGKSHQNHTFEPKLQRRDLFSVPSGEKTLAKIAACTSATDFDALYSGNMRRAARWMCNARGEKPLSRWCCLLPDEAVQVAIVLILMYIPHDRPSLWHSPDMFLL